MPNSNPVQAVQDAARTVGSNFGSPKETSFQPDAKLSDATTLLRRETTGSDVGLTPQEGQQASKDLVDNVNTVAEAASSDKPDKLDKVMEGLQTIISMLEKLLQGKEDKPADQAQPGSQGSGGAGGACEAGGADDAEANDPKAMLKKIIEMMKKLGFSDKAIESMLTNMLKGAEKDLGLSPSDIRQMVAEAGAGSQSGTGDQPPPSGLGTVTTDKLPTG
jgi:hypothetical protein